MKKMLFILLLFSFSLIFAENYHDDILIYYDDGNSNADTALGIGTPVDGVWFSNSFEIPFEVPCKLTELEYYAKRSGLVDFKKIVVAPPNKEVDLNGNAPDLDNALFEKDNVSPINGMNSIDLGEKITTSQNVVASFRFPKSTQLKMGVDFNSPWAKKSFMTFSDYSSPPTGAPQNNNFIIRLKVRPIFFIKRSEIQPQNIFPGKEKQNLFNFKIFSGRESVTLNSLDFSYEQDGSDDLFSSVSLYLDSNKDGKLDASDIKIKETTDISSSKITFSSLNLKIATFTLKNFILVAKIKNNITTTTKVKISINSFEDVDAISGVTNSEISPYLYNATGNFVNFKGVVNVNKNSSSPTGKSVFYNEKNFAVLSFDVSASAENMSLNKLPVFIQGTLTPYQDIEKLRLFEDKGTLGVFDSKDVEIASPVNFSVTSPETIFQPTLNINAGKTVHLLIVASLSGTADGGNSFYFSLNPTHIELLDSSLQSVFAEGDVLSSSVFIVSGGVNAEKLPLLPTTIFVQKNSSQDLMFVSFKSEGENSDLDSIKLLINGNLSSIDKITIFEDVNRNGKFDSGDSVLGEENPKSEVDFKNIDMLIFDGKESWLGMRVKFNNQLKGGDVFSFKINSAKATGSGSSVLVNVAGFPIVSGNIVGKGALKILLGSHSPVQKILLPGKENDSLIQVKILPEDDVFSLKKIVFSADGTADDTTLFTNLKLVLDKNNNGVFDVSDEVLKENVFDSDDGSLVFDSLDLTVDKKINLLVVGSFENSIENKNRTFSISLADKNSVVATYKSSGKPVEVSAQFPIFSPKFIVGGGGLVFKGSKSSGDSVISSGMSGVPVLQFSIFGGAENFYFKRFVFELQNLAPISKITAVNLVLDENANGVIDANETTVFPAVLENGKFVVDANYMLNSNIKKYFILSVDFGTLTSGDEFIFTLTNIDAMGQSSGSSDVSGLPISSSRKFVEGKFSFSYNVLSGNFKENQQNLVVMPFTLSSKGEDFSISNINISASGSLLDDQNVASVKLVEDLDNDKKFSQSDLVLDEKWFLEDDGTISFNLNTSILNNKEKHFLIVYNIASNISSGAVFRTTFDSIKLYGSISKNKTLVINKTSGNFVYDAGLNLSLQNKNNNFWIEKPFPKEKFLNGFFIQNLSSHKATISSFKFNLNGDDSNVDKIEIYEDSNNSKTFDKNDISIGELDENNEISLSKEILNNEKKLFFVKIYLSQNLPAQKLVINLSKITAFDDENNSISINSIPLTIATLNYFGDLSFIKNREINGPVYIFKGAQAKTILDFSMKALSSINLEELTFSSDEIPENMDFQLKCDKETFLGSIKNNLLTFKIDKTLAKDSQTSCLVIVSQTSEDDFYPFKIKLENSGVKTQTTTVFAGLPLISPYIVKSSVFSYSTESEFKTKKQISSFYKFPIMLLNTNSLISLTLNSITPVFKGKNMVKKYYIIEDSNQNKLLDSEDKVLFKGKIDEKGEINQTFKGKKSYFFAVDIDENSKPGDSFSMLLNQNSFKVSSNSKEILVKGDLLNSGTFILPTVLSVLSSPLSGSKVNSIFKDLKVASFSLTSSGDDFRLKEIEGTNSTNSECSVVYSLYMESDDNDKYSSGDIFVSPGNTDGKKISFSFQNLKLLDKKSKKFYIIAKSSGCFGSFSINLDSLKVLPMNLPDFVIKGLPVSSGIFSSNMETTQNLDLKTDWFGFFFDNQPTPVFSIKNNNETTQKINLKTSNNVDLVAGNDNNLNFKLENREIKTTLKKTKTKDFEILNNEKMLFELQKSENFDTNFYINNFPIGSISSFKVLVSLNPDRKTATFNGDLSKLKIFTVKSNAKQLFYTKKSPLKSENTVNCVKKGDETFACTTDFSGVEQEIFFSSEISEISKLTDLNLKESMQKKSFFQKNNTLKFADFKIKENAVKFTLLSFGKTKISFFAKKNFKVTITQNQKEITPDKNGVFFLDYGKYEATFQPQTDFLATDFVKIFINSEAKYYISGFFKTAKNQFVLAGDFSVSANGFIPSCQIISNNILSFKSELLNAKFYDKNGIENNKITSNKIFVAFLEQAGVINDFIFTFTADDKEFSTIVPLKTEITLKTVELTPGKFALFSDKPLHLKSLTIQTASRYPIQNFGKFLILETLSNNGKIATKQGFSELLPQTEIPLNIDLLPGNPFVFQLKRVGNENHPNNEDVFYSIKNANAETFLGKEVELDNNFATFETTKSAEISDFKKFDNKIVFKVKNGEFIPLKIPQDCSFVEENQEYTFLCQKDGVFTISAFVVKQDSLNMPLFGSEKLFLNSKTVENNSAQKLVGGGCSTLYVENSNENLKFYIIILLSLLLGLILKRVKSNKI